MTVAMPYSCHVILTDGRKPTKKVWQTFDRIRSEIFFVSKISRGFLHEVTIL